MGNFLGAILKHENNEIRVLVRNNPSLASGRSPAGVQSETPIKSRQELKGPTHHRYHQRPVLR